MLQIMEIVIEDLIKQLGSKYALASLCAKRARDLNTGAKVLSEDISGKADAIALREINQNLVHAVSKPKIKKSDVVKTDILGIAEAA